MNKKEIQQKLNTILFYAFDALSDAKIIVDKDGMILYASPFHYKNLGIEREEDIIGKYVCDIIPGTRMHIVVKTETPEYGYIFRFVNRHTKKVTPVVCNRMPIYDKQGNLLGALSETTFPAVEDVITLAKEIEHLNMSTNLPAHTSQSKKIENYIVGVSSSIKELRTLVDQVANFPLPVLITGETGTGKEVFASAIHKFSNRCANNFVKINCAAIPNELLESELFGYESGAFSGAVSGGKMGKFEYAKNGSILLDEIGDMPLNLQAKLLRAIQEKEFEKVGGLKSIPFNSRIICTTNQNISQLIENKLFRQDLYYRINVIEFVIPPLRARKEDIDPLCRYFIEKINRENGLGIVGVSRDAMKILEKYDWPGNVRELYHALEQACFMIGSGVLESDQFLQVQLKLNAQNELTLPSYSFGSTPRTLDEVRAGAEIAAIKDALRETRGNKSKAAKILQIDRTILYDKIHKYAIQAE